MIIELHLLQSFPVSNLNRDDLGQPKTATFGGHLRARISSQSLKRAARFLMPSYDLDDSDIGVRTRLLVQKAAERLTESGRDGAESAGVVAAGLRELGFGYDAKKQTTQYLLFLGHKAPGTLAAYCDNEWDRLKAVADKAAEAEVKPRRQTKKAGENEGDGDKAGKARPKKGSKEYEEARRLLDATRAVDIACFGRMIADNADFNVQAAAQVAHALSTHAVVTEYDYFTAVDDFNPESETGAGMIGTFDFNAACYYRYANLDLTQLDANLDGDTALVGRAASAWLKAFIHAVPGGKQNVTAARTPPETLLAVVRERGAWNLANAFLEPVAGANLLADSTERLFGHFQRLRAFYRSFPLQASVAATVAGSRPDIADVTWADSDEDFVGAVLRATKAGA